MNIDELTLSDIKILTSIFNRESNESAFEVGKKYFIRTATYHCTGELIKITPTELVLKNAAWIADSGRLYDALIYESFEEVEPFINDLIVNRMGIIDATKINAVPIEQK